MCQLARFSRAIKRISSELNNSQIKLHLVITELWKIFARNIKGYFSRLKLNIKKKDEMEEFVFGKKQKLGGRWSAPSYMYICIVSLFMSHRTIEIKLPTD